MLLLIAFTVVAGTLFLQGLSLPMLARRLRVPSPDPMEDALARATLLQQASKAGFKVLQQLEYDDQQGVVKLVKQRIEQRNFAAWERLGTQADVETPSELYARVRLAMLEAERTRVLEIRDAGQVASEVVSEVLAMLDVEESMIDVAQASREELKTEYSRVRRTGATCDHLDSRPVQEVEQEPAPVCQACVDDGYTWVSLRLCLECGNIGCCDSSVNRHATAHFRETTHPVMQSAEPLRGLALVLRAPRHRLSEPALVEEGRAGRTVARARRDAVLLTSHRAIFVTGASALSSTSGGGRAPGCAICSSRGLRRRSGRSSERSRRRRLAVSGSGGAGGCGAAPEVPEVAEVGAAAARRAAGRGGGLVAAGAEAARRRGGAGRGGGGGGGGGGGEVTSRKAGSLPCCSIVQSVLISR